MQAGPTACSGADPGRSRVPDAGPLLQTPSAGRCPSHHRRAGVPQERIGQVRRATDLLGPAVGLVDSPGQGRPGQVGGLDGLGLVYRVAVVRVAALVRYMAVSASRSRSSGVDWPPGRAATPVLTPTVAVTAASTNGSTRQASSRRAASAASSWTAPGSRTMNSSPPSRARVSPSRRQPANRAPTCRSSSSPASCPRVSLTCLNPSRSRNSRPTDEPRCARARSSRSNSRARLGRPVRGSWKAC